MEFAPQGPEYKYRTAQYYLHYPRNDLSETQLLSEVMRNALELGHPVSEVMTQYEQAKRLCPKLYCGSPHLIQVPEVLAKKGYYEQSIWMFEDLLAAAEKLPGDRDAHAIFQKALPGTIAEYYTFERFKELNQKNLHQIEEVYVKFMVTTNKQTPYTAQRGLEIAERLVRASPTATRIELLAQALAVNGQFETAIEKLEEAVKLHKKAADPPGQAHLFLKKIDDEKVAFASKTLILSTTY